MMCRLDLWSSKHHTTRMSTWSYVLPVRLSGPAWHFCLCVPFIPHPSLHPSSSLLFLRPSSCPLLPTGRELVTTRGIQLTSVTVSSVSFALTQRHWVMCLRHKCWRVCAAEKQTCGESSPAHCLSDRRFLCAKFTFVPTGGGGGVALVLLAARHRQTLH